MKRWVVLGLAISALVAAGVRARAGGHGDDDDDDDRADDRGGDDDADSGDDDSDDRGGDDDGGGVKPNRVKPNKKGGDDDGGDDDGDDDGGGGDDDDGGDRGKKGGDDDGGGDNAGGGDDGGGGEGDEVFERNKDHTRPGGGRTDQNSFQKLRFFVDKDESAKTAKGTLYQGSITSSSFVYRETGGTLDGAAGATGVTSNSKFMRMFTDLRAQLDALHIGGTRWDFRLDGRARVMNDPKQSTQNTVNPGISYPTRVQGGVFGKNEYELKELWLVRGGDRADVFMGRQYVADLGAIKIDGLRVDYASSPQLTFIGFGGAYPYRGSRSLSTDYIKGKDAAGVSTGRVIPLAFGGGAAYRTEHTYGSFGGVAIVPFKGEQPRVYATASGYWRTGPKLDFYHFAVVDLYGSAGAALTNLSAGINTRPAPRIQANASINHVDTETLDITARAFLNEPETNVIRNDTFVQRIASDQARGGLSVALGDMQQVELSTSLTYRRRPSFSLSDGMALVQSFPASSSVEALFQALHRSLFKQVRVGVDVSRIFKVGGGASYARTASLQTRVYASREFQQGKGEWDAEVAYTAAKDTNTDISCNLTTLETCYGSSRIGLLEVGGSAYYRLREDIFMIALANVGRYSLQYLDVAGVRHTDPAVTSISAFIRLAYRF